MRDLYLKIELGANLSANLSKALAAQPNIPKIRGSPAAHQSREGLVQSQREIKYIDGF